MRGRSPPCCRRGICPMTTVDACRLFWCSGLAQERSRESYGIEREHVLSGRVMASPNEAIWIGGTAFVQVHVCRAHRAYPPVPHDGEDSSPHLPITVVHGTQLTMKLTDRQIGHSCQGDPTTGQLPDRARERP